MVNEKRFIVESVMIDCLCEDEPRIAKVITDTDENYSYEDLYEVAELLNEQQATNSALRTENNHLIGVIKEYAKKYEEQQSTTNKVYELLEEADIFSDKATEHDIKAYIELQEFDNKDAYYLACGIKKAIKLLKGGDVDE